MDVALQYDPVKKRCDVVFNGRDFALDSTPVSAALFSLFAERRAAPDDVLPDVVADWATPSTFIARRGWVGDALDLLGRLTGCRLWLIARAKQTEAVRQAVEGYLSEALGWLNTDRNYAVQITVRWAGAGVLGMLVRIGNTSLSLTRALG